MAFSFEKMQDVNLHRSKNQNGKFNHFETERNRGKFIRNRADYKQEVMCHLVSESVVEITEAGSVVYD